MDQHREQRESVPDPDSRVCAKGLSSTESIDDYNVKEVDQAETDLQKQLSKLRLQNGTDSANTDDSVTVARPAKPSSARLGSSSYSDSQHLEETHSVVPQIPSSNLNQESSDDSEVTVVSRKPPHSVHGNPTSTQQLGELLLGKQLGTFQLDRFLGSGGMGAVFQATDTQLHRQVAVKVLKNTDGDPDAIRRFRTEAQSAARLDHENIARVYHVGQDQGWNYIVLELVDGLTLRQLVAESGPLSFDVVLNYFQQLAAALQHAHHRQIIHRDIKPSNVIITSDDKVKLVDMGLARIISSERQGDETEDGMTLGTFDYIAPEQARDPKSADEQSDLYSLGCTLFFALTGRPPFAGGNAIEKILNHNSAPRPNVGDFRNDLPQAANLIVTRLMAPNKVDRIASADELGQALAYLQQPKSIRIAKIENQPIGFRVPVLLAVAAATVFVLASLMDDPVIQSSIVFPDIPGKSVKNEEVGNAPAIESNDTDSVLSNVPSATIAPFNSEVLTEDAGSAVDAEADSPFDLKLRNQIRDGSVFDADDPLNWLSERLRPTIFGKRNSISGSVDSDSISDEIPFSREFDGLSMETFDSIENGNPQSEESVLQTTTIQVRPSIRNGEKPKVSLRPNTRLVGSFEEAVSSLQKYSNVHTIELCFDEQLECQPIVIDSLTLRVIKAGDGFRPKLRFISDSQRTSRSLIVVESGTLEVNGIDWSVDLSSDRSLSLFDFPKLNQLQVSDCSFTFDSNRFDQATGHWVDVNTSKLISGARPAQSSVSFTDCAVRGNAELVQVESFSPIQIKLVNVWMVTPANVFEFGGVPDGTIESSAEIDIQNSTLVTGESLVSCSATSLNKHGQLLIRSKRSILAAEGEQALIRHDGQVQWKSNQVPLYFEGLQNKIAADIVWSISSKADFLNRSYSLKQAVGQVWFRQTDWIDVTDVTLSDSDLSVASMTNQADWAFLPKTLASRQTGVDSIGAEANSLPDFPSDAKR